MRKQHHLRPVDGGWDAWDVDRLIALSRDLPVERIAVAAVAELDTAYWFEGSGEEPTVRKVVEHVRLIAAVDLAHPVVLDPDGRVMDGMHRVARALLEGRSHLPAVRLRTLPAPDLRVRHPDELPG